MIARRRGALGDEGRSATEVSASQRLAGGVGAERRATAGDALYVGLEAGQPAVCQVAQRHVRAGSATIGHLRCAPHDAIQHRGGGDAGARRVGYGRRSQADRCRISIPRATFSGGACEDDEQNDGDAAGGVSHCFGGAVGRRCLKSCGWASDVARDRQFARRTNCMTV
jgi:hypothetical protein